MKKKNLLSFLLLALIAFIGFSSFSLSSQAAEVRRPIFRVYNPNSGEHLFTPSPFEYKTLINFGWNFEGTAFYVPNPDNSANLENPSVTRLYNPNDGDHHYTIDTNEIVYLMKVGWDNDQLGFLTSKDGQPVYRLYNPNAKAGAHHFTLDKNERDYLVKIGWQAEGVGFKAYASL